MFTFDGPNKTITLDDSSPDIEVVNVQMYSRWVDWVQSGNLNAGFGEVLKAEGKIPIGGGGTTGEYVFLSQGWTVVVPATVSEVTIKGNFTRDPDDTSGAPLITNQGGALVTLERSEIAVGVATGGSFSDAHAQLLQDIYDDVQTVKPLIDIWTSALKDAVVATINRVLEMWGFRGLDVGKPVVTVREQNTVTETYDGNVVSHTDNGTNSVTKTRL